MTVKERIENKELLLKDISARLSYGVKGRIYAECSKGEYDIDGYMIFSDSPFDVTLDDINISTEEIHVIAIGNDDTIAFIEDQQTWGNPYTIDEFKPYLRPMSSMTEEEKNELKEYLDAYEVDCNGFGYSEGGTLEDYISSIPYSICVVVVDWLNKKMFDHRGLIPAGLALSTEEYNPYV